MKKKHEEKKSSKRKKKNKLTAGVIIGRIFGVLGITVLMILLFAIGVVAILMKGPSSEATRIFTMSAQETSAIKWLPKLFISENEFNDILHPVQVTDDYEELPFDKSVATTAEDDTVIAEEEELPEIEIVDLLGSSYKGKLMIVRNPARVTVGAIDSFGGVGKTLSAFLDKYDAVGCTNAGGFMDENGSGKGGIPDGIVIQNGQIVYGSAGSSYTGVAGFDENHILHVGNMTGQQALDCGIKFGTNFANGPVLIQDGVSRKDIVSGINPRTCIGQTADGTVLLIAIEGRLADSLGATYDDLVEIMEEYGAINAVNLDGGSSSGMYYEGERITRSSSLIGDRPLPTAIIVLK